MVFVNPDGSERDRIIGFDGDKEKYFNIIKDYAADINTVGTLEKAYQKDTLSVEANYKLAKKYYERWKSLAALKHLENVLKLDVDGKSAYYTDTKFLYAVIHARYVENVNPTLLIDFLSQTDNKDFLSEGYNNLAQYYKGAKDTSAYYSCMEKRLEISPDDANLHNEFAWDIYVMKLADKYSRGLEIAIKANELKPNDASILDTVAWLYFVNGNYGEAQMAMEKAVKINPNFKPSQDKLLDSIKAAS